MNGKQVKGLLHYAVAPSVTIIYINKYIMAFEDVCSTLVLIRTVE